jgi:hypothetical protein
MQLDQLELERGAIVGDVKTFRAETKTIIYDGANSFYLNVAAKIPDWIKEYEIKQPMKLYEVIHTKTATERVIEEIITMLSDAVINEAKHWQTEKLQPLLDSCFNDLAERIDDKVSKFLIEVEEARKQIFWEANIDISSDALQEKIGLFERILAASTGFVAFGVGAGALGATFGLKEMLKGAIPQVLVGMTVVIFTGWNPFILIPALLMAGGIQGLFKMKATNKQIRDKVGKAFESKIREFRAENSSEIAKLFDKKFQVLEQGLDQELSLKIQSIRDQVNAILEEKQQGRAQIEVTKRHLKNVGQESNAIDVEIDELVKQIALNQVRL